jgi:cytochrome c-type biogenesis protein CcmH
MMRFVVCLMMCLMFSLPAAAVLPDEVLGDPALEARARMLTREIKCLVCQGESIDESNAPFAADLRRLVRQRLSAGDSDVQVKDYLVARYGEYILLRPQLGVHTLILWVMPFALLAAAAGALVRHQRRMRAKEEA